MPASKLVCIRILEFCMWVPLPGDGPSTQLQARLQARTWYPPKPVIGHILENFGMGSQLRQAMGNVELSLRSWFFSACERSSEVRCRASIISLRHSMLPVCTAAAGSPLPESASWPHLPGSPLGTVGFWSCFATSATSATSAASAASAQGRPGFPSSRTLSRTTLFGARSCGRLRPMWHRVGCAFGSLVALIVGCAVLVAGWWRSSA